MIPDITKSYPAKILLAGEYTVLTGSAILAVPFGEYKASWKKHPGGDRGLRNFYAFLKRNCNDFLNEEAIEEIEKNYSFDSNIPQGFGLGSSGALVAGIFDLSRKAEKHTPLQLKNYLGQMESYFHGTSSGFDPLVSYIQAPLLQDAKANISHVRFAGRTDLFLYNSNIPRQQKDLIPLFLKKRSQLEAEIYALSELNTILCQRLIAGQKNDISEILLKISRLQLQILPEAIPDGILKLWMEGLESGNYFLKLCGAGGGGYYLVYTPNKEWFPDSSKLISFNPDNS